MAATDEMLAIALRHLPNACCLVPERREERTTEGGLNVAGGGARLERIVGDLKDAGVRVSLFIEPDAAAVEASQRIGADIVELHTGAYCERALEGDAAGVARELERITAAARLADAAGLEVHAGHGLTFDTVAAVSRLPQIVELNIGHFLIGEAIFVGLSSCRAAHARPDGRSAQGCRRGMPAREVGVIFGVGNDLIDIRRIEKTLERYGERFIARVFTEVERKKSDAPPPASRLLRQALCRQGGLRQGAGHGAAPRRLLARHGRRESALGPPNPEANRWSGKGFEGADAGRLRSAHRSDHHRRFPARCGHRHHFRHSGEGRPALTKTGAAG